VAIFTQLNVFFEEKGEGRRQKRQWYNPIIQEEERGSGSDVIQRQSEATETATAVKYSKEAVVTAAT